MKVGILTYQDSANFGTMMQAYAVRQACANLGHDVSVIDYRRSATQLFYIKQALVQSNTIGMFRKGFACRRFGKNHLNLTRPVRTPEQLTTLSNELDCICVGSDQIWDATNPHGFSPSFFMSFANTERTRLISYAPSCGAMSADKIIEHEEMGRLLKRFHHISARDANTAECVRRTSGIEPTLVLDPTFLVDYPSFPTKAVPKEPYTLVYGSPAAVRKAGIEAQARQLGLPIVNAGFRSIPGGIDRVGIGPGDWVELYRNATYIITTFFHGLIFSVLFRKPFVIISLPGKANKVGNLLERLDMKDRLFSPGDDPKGLIEQIKATDYARTEPLLAAEIDRSRRYLAEAMVA